MFIEMEKYVVPVLYGNEERKSKDIPLSDIENAPLSVTECSRALQNLMVSKSICAYDKIMSIDTYDWLEKISSVGKSLNTKLEKKESLLMQQTTAASICSGIATNRIRKALASIAEYLIHIEEIIKNQTDNYFNHFDATQNLNNKTWRYIASGKNVAVKIPGNYPTININWLLILAMKRPVLLSSSFKDPVTPVLLARELYAANIPDGSISVVCEDFETFQNRCDQLLISGNPDAIHDSNKHKAKQYHNGKSKVIFLEKELTKTTLKRLAYLAIKGSGKLCTNMSTLLVTENDMKIASLLAGELLKITAIDNIEKNSADSILPFFTDTEEIDGITETIRSAITNGATDITQKISDYPLIVTNIDGKTYLRPTVLLMEPDNPVFNTELPFPFVIVSKVAYDDLVKTCDNSLIVSLIGSDTKIRNALIRNPHIDKVFYGDRFDRGYHPLDTHEGFLFDFIFKKKTILP